MILHLVLKYFQMILLPNVESFVYLSMHSLHLQPLLLSSFVLHQNLLVHMQVVYLVDLILIFLQFYPFHVDYLHRFDIHIHENLYVLILLLDPFLDHMLLQFLHHIYHLLIEFLGNDFHFQVIQAVVYLFFLPLYLLN